MPAAPSSQLQPTACGGQAQGKRKMEAGDRLGDREHRSDAIKRGRSAQEQAKAGDDAENDVGLQQFATCLRQPRCLYSAGSSPADCSIESCSGACLEQNLGILLNLMASLGSCNYPVFYLRYPPPPFNCDLAGTAQDQEDLPDIKELISGQYGVMIDVTGDSDNEVGHHIHKHE
jgi:hypothetical protein